MIFTQENGQLGLFGKPLSDVYKDAKSKQGLLYSFFSGSGLTGSLSKSDIANLTYLQELFNAGDIEAANVALNNLSPSLSVAGKKMGAEIITGSNNFDNLSSSIAGATVKTIGLNVASTALSAAISMGIAFAIQGVITLVSDLIHAQENLHNKVQELIQDYQSQRNELIRNQAEFNNLAKRYGELSKGVNDLGQNVSLSKEEYEEYRQVVNSLVEINPTLATGFTKQGDAILSCKDNVEELTASYNELLRAANNVIINDASDVFKDFKNQAAQITGLDASLLGGLSYDPKKLTQSAVNALDEILNGPDIDEAISKYAGGGSANAVAIIKAIKDKTGIKQDWLESGSDFIKRAVQENRTVLQAIVDEWNKDVEDSTDGVASIAEAYIGNAMMDGYNNITPTMQNLINQIIGGYNYDFYSQFRDKESLFSHLNGLLAQFDSLGAEGAQKIEIVFDLQTKYNNGDCTVGEYIAAINDLEGIVSSFDTDTQKAILLSLGFDGDDITDQFDSILNHFRTLNGGELRSWLFGLSQDEFQLVYSLSLDDSSAEYTLADLQEQIEEIKKAQIILDFDFDAESEGYDNVIQAIKGSVSEIGLNAEQIDKLNQRYATLKEQGYDLSKLYEMTENGIHLNAKALAELESAYERQTRTGLDDYLEDLIAQYNDLTAQINDTGDATGELGTQRDNLGSQIENVRALAAQYDGLTSSFNKWKQAQSMGEEGDMYDGVTSGLKDIKELYEEGLIGTNKFRAAVQMMTDEDVSTKSGDELVGIYEEAMPKMERYFKDGHDGVVNFLKDVNRLNSDWAHINEDGNWEIDFGVGGDKDIAEALGISTEGVQMVLRKLKDFGFEINLDSMYSDLGLKATTAEEALTEVNAKIAETQESLASGTGDTEQLESQLEQYENAKGLIESITNADASLDLDTMTLDEAIEKISALEQMMASGIELPITLAGQYDELKAFIDKIGAEQNIPIDIPLSTSGTGKEEVDQTSEAVEKLDAENADIELKATDNAGETITSVSDAVDEIPEDPNINLNATDNTSGAITSADTALDTFEAEPRDVTISVTEDGSDTAQGNISSVANADYPATITVEEFGGAAVSAAIDAIANKPRTATITTKYEEAPITGNEPGYVDNTHVNEDGITVGYSGVLPYSTKEPDNGNDYEMVAPAQTWKDSPIPPSIGVDIEANDNAGQQIVEQVQDQVDSQPPIEWSSGEESEEIKARKDLEGESVEVPVEAKNPEAIIDEVQQVASTEPVQISADETSLDRTDMSKVSSHIGELSDVARVKGGAAKEVTELTNAYIALGNAQKEVSNVDVSDPAAVEAASSGLAEAAANFQTAYTNLQNKLGDTSSVEVDAETETALSKIQALAETNPTATINLDSSAVDSYQPEDKPAQADYFVDDSAVNSWTPPTKHGAVIYSAGDAGAAGTAHAQGTAFANGNWGAKESGVALGGELGQEIIVRKGRFFTIGDSGAEFFKYKRGDIIFNADQTRELFEKGKITSAAGRGKVYAEGTAFSFGTAASNFIKKLFGGGTKKSSSSNSSSKKKTKKKSSSGSSSSSKKTTNDENDVFDWIEVAIDRIERLIDDFARIAESSYKTLKVRLGATADEITSVAKEISTQQKGYERYIKQANSIALSDDLKKKVREGTIDINEYKGETLDLINDYQEWYEKAIDCADAVDELNEKLSELYESRFEAIQSDFDAQLDLLEHQTNSYSNGLDMIEERGLMGGNALYQEMLKIERQNIAVQKNELTELTKALSDAVNSGAIEESSEAWYGMQSEINAVKEAIQESELAVVEYGNSIRELNWEIFDYMQERISKITDESEFLIELMESSKLFEDNGQMTNTGMAQLGLHALNYDVNMDQSDKYADELKKINAEVANDPSNTNLIERKEELIDLQRESILAAEDEKRAVADLVEQGINLELDALKDLIGAYEDSIDSAKDLYDYQKRVKDQSEEIAALQKQLAAYQGDTSEENRARLQKLTIDLSDAMDELQETQYDQYVKDQKKLLGDMYDEYEAILNARLDDIDVLMNEMIDEANANAADIAQTIREESDAVGYTLTDGMANIWSGIETDTILVKYGDTFTAQFTTLTSVLNGIAAHIASMVGAGDALASETASSTTPTTEIVKPPKPEPTHEPESALTPVQEITKKEVKVVNGQWWLYKSGAKRGKTGDIVHTGETFEYLGEDKASNGAKYTKIKYKGSTRWFNSKGAKKLGFSQGGFVADLQKVAYNNGDDIVSFNSLERGEAVLTPEQSIQFAKLADNLPQLQSIVDVSDHLRKIRAFDNTSNNEIYIDVGGINIPIGRVIDYNDFVKQLQSDDKFEKMIQSMTIDRINGGSQLSKHKYNW